MPATSLASALSAVAGRMDPAEAARPLADALGHETDAYARSSLASALSEVAGRMDPTEAARICGQAAKTLADASAMRRMPMPARAWHRRCRRWRAGSRPHASRQAAKTLAEALGHETDANARRPWHRRCRRWRAGWTRPRPLGSAAM